MFLSLRKPTELSIQAFIASHRGTHFSYSPAGASRGTPPPGFVVDHTRAKIGGGKLVFQRAVTAIREWKHFGIDWVELCYPRTPIEVGNVVAVLVRAFGMWCLNGCRIVYLLDERGPVTRFGFAYGTLPSHAESGEERFSVEWHAKDDAVWYDIFAFSRPNHALTWLGYPLVRRLQKRFASDSVIAMARSVVENGNDST